jgi:CheY-like chemotaxis protein
MDGDTPILLVEDDKIDVMNVKRAFMTNGISNPLFVASDGEDALAFLRHTSPYEEPAKAPRPGIVLLDINMPVMNGIEFLRAVKSDKDLKSIPIVVLTTSQEESDRLRSFELSVAGYIIKPVGYHKFVETVKVIDRYWTLSELP